MLIGVSLVLLLCHSVFSQLLWSKLVDNLSYQSNTKPAPRRDSALGFDIDRNRLIVFGGLQVSTDTQLLMPVLLDDTWEFRLDSSNFLPFYLAT